MTEVTSHARDDASIGPTAMAKSVYPSQVKGCQHDTVAAVDSSTAESLGKPPDSRENGFINGRVRRTQKLLREALVDLIEERGFE